MDNTTIVKNQHYVPAFYLKNFVNKTGEIEIFNCKERRILSPKGPKGICCEEFFYGAKTGQADNISQLVEDLFRTLENNLAPRVQEIIPKILNYEPIEPADKGDIAFLMSMLWIRGPVMRGQINSWAEEAIKFVTTSTFSMKPEMLDEIDKKVDWKESDEETRKKCREWVLNGEFNVVVNNQHHMMMFDKIDKFANLFFGQDWVVYIVKEGRTFITTDNPVAMEIPETKSFYGPTFLQRTHYFSLTPNICIVARHPQQFDGKKFHRKSLFNKDDKRIFELNFKLGGYSHLYAYSRDKKNFEDILKLLALEEACVNKAAQHNIKMELNKHLAQR